MNEGGGDVVEDDGLGLGLEEDEIGEPEKEEDNEKKIEADVDDHDKSKCTLLSKEIIYYMRVVVMQILRHFQDIHEKLLHQTDFLHWIQLQETKPEFKKIIAMKQQLPQFSQKVIESKKKEIKIATQNFAKTLVPHLQELALGTIFNASAFIMKYNRPFPEMKLRQTANSWAHLEILKRKKNGMLPFLAPKAPPPPQPSFPAASFSTSASSSASASLLNDDLKLLEQELLAESSFSTLTVKKPQNIDPKDHRDYKHSLNPQAAIPAPPPPIPYLTPLQKQKIREAKNEIPTEEGVESAKEKAQPTSRKRRRLMKLDDPDVEDKTQNGFHETRLFATEKEKRKSVTPQTLLPLEERNQPPLHNYADLEAVASDNDD